MTTDTTDEAAIRAELQHLWQHEIAQQTANLATAWAPAGPPPADEWPGYALTKTRTIRRATKLLTATTLRARVSGPPQIEVQLHDPATGLWGRADRIEREGADTRIVDLKTGLQQDEPTDDQRRQLLLYAVLVHRTTGQWPTSLVIEDASGTRYTEPLDATSAENALADVQSAVASFNSATDKNLLIDRAEPTAERCDRCAFRVVCRPYWDALASSWGHRSLMGAVTGVGHSDGGAFIDIHIESPSDRAGEKVHLSRLAGIGTNARKAAVVGWHGPTDGADLRARWSTVVRTW